MKIKKKTIWLFVVIMAIIALIIAFQQTKVPLSETETSTIKVGESVESTEPRVLEKEKQYQRAIELISPDGYLNINNITIGEHVGKKVILVDFWTYSCINCQRTFPYLNSWWEKYKDKGLIIIGIHTPEFEFEKEKENVREAIAKYSIKYPVVQDNNYFTWRAYKNRYWPRKYLIDIDGFVVYDHIGEGGYAETERKIIELLEERNKILGSDINVNGKNITSDDFIIIPSDLTSEVYFGYAFARGHLGNSEGWQSDKEIDYALPLVLKKDKFYLEGKWKNNPDHMGLVSDTGKILLNYTAKDVHIVAGADAPTRIEVIIDGKERGNVEINGYGLYTLANESEYNNHLMEIRADKGLQAYTFTFG